MAPSNSKKGGSSKPAPRDRRSSSRQSTPLSAADSVPQTPTTATPTSMSTSTLPAAAASTDKTPIGSDKPTTSSMPKETAYIHTSTAALVNEDPGIEALMNDTSKGGNAADPPSAKELQGIHDAIKSSIMKTMNKRGEVCDRSMRQLAQKRKANLALEREQEAARAEEEAKRAKAERKKVGKKRSADEMEGVERVKKEEMEEVEEKKGGMPDVGARGVARQDGVGVGEGAPAPPSPVIAPKTDGPDLMDTADSPSDSDDSNPEPSSTAPLYEKAFGKDPTQSYDPTIYDIREIHDDMTGDEKRAILNVAQWPESDLNELTAGDPPDEDFSKQKPLTQVSAATFATYVEPFIRPFTEEDVAFLKERPDRVAPFLIPQRGARGYKEVWAAEDGMEGVAAPRQRERERNEARGSMEEMGDEVAETDEVSLGPVMGRLLSILRPTPSKKKDDKDNKDANKNDDDADGDTTMTNGIDPLPNGIDSQDTQALPGAEVEHKPATYLPPDAPRLQHLIPADYDTLESRAIQELRHIGFLPPNENPDFGVQSDDEVAARLRTLQHELRRLSRLNNVRKARVLELTEERMAMQEYANIADDLDNQVNAAYLKRNRTLSKTPSHKKGSSQARPGQAKGLASAGGFGARGVSDGVRALMQKRRDWIDMVGPVVSYGRPPIPGDGDTVFDEGNLRRLERVEREVEADAGEGEGEGE